MLFVLGAGHIYQIVKAENFTPGTAGVIHYTDISESRSSALLCYGCSTVTERARGKALESRLESTPR